MKKPFYKLKKFYIPVFVLMLLFIILIKLLYSPLYLIYWIENDYAQEEQKLTEYRAYIKNPFEYINKFKPKLEDFKALNEKMKRVVFDFKIAKFFGFEDRYYRAVMQYIPLASFIIISEQGFFIYMNDTIPKSFVLLNDEQKQQYFNLKASTQNLEKEIFNEKLEFIQHFEEFYNYLEDTGYLNQGVWYRGTANMPRVILYYAFLADNKKNNIYFCSLKDKELFFNRLKESYNTLEKLDIKENDPFFILREKFLNVNKEILNQTRKYLDECE